MPYPALARELGWRVAPGFMADRARRYERDFREREGVTAIARALGGGGPVRVRHGPFQGMSYPEDRLGDVAAPVAKLMGTYELEIHDALMAALARGARTFIDVGCADGYFAVGLPYVDHAVRTYAFDLSRDARELCAEVARTNSLEANVEIGKRFAGPSLDAIDCAGALMLCDIEGAERTLFDDGLIGRLAQTSVIIEVHEQGAQGLSAALRNRFDRTHGVMVVEQVRRQAVDGVAPGVLAELRPPDQHWLVCNPR